MGPKTADGHEPRPRRTAEAVWLRPTKTGRPDDRRSSEADVKDCWRRMGCTIIDAAGCHGWWMGHRIKDGTEWPWVGSSDRTGDRRWSMGNTTDTDRRWRGMGPGRHRQPPRTDERWTGWRIAEGRGAGRGIYRPATATATRCTTERQTGRGEHAVDSRTDAGPDADTTDAGHTTDTTISDNATGMGATADIYGGHSR